MFIEKIRISIKNIFGFDRPIPQEHRNNFKNLFFDVAWFGILNGSSITFLNIYSARIGGTTFQIGLITAAPAIIALLSALPVSLILGRKRISRTVFISSVLNRSLYSVFVFLPFLFPQLTQIAIIIIITFLMSIPGTTLTIGFNGLLGKVVPIEWRGEVAGIRNAILAATTTFSTILSGFILRSLPFRQGYTLVFGIGFLAAMLSSFYLFHIYPQEDLLESKISTLNNQKWLNIFRVDILKGEIKKDILLISLFHFALYIAIPIFPIFLVNRLHLIDQVISLGTSVFFIAIFISSTQLSRLSRRFQNKTIFGVGALMMGIYPCLITLSNNTTFFLFVNLLGGIAWSLSGGILYNYLLEKSPENDRPGYLAWFNLGSNAAILFGSLVGPIISNNIGISNALIVFAIIRSMVGALILLWG